MNRRVSEGRPGRETLNPPVRGGGGGTPRGTPGGVPGGPGGTPPVSGNSGWTMLTLTRGTSGRRLLYLYLLSIITDYCPERLLEATFTALQSQILIV